MIQNMWLFLFFCCFFHSANSQDIVFVNGSVKTGSATLDASFRNLDIKTYHRHNLTEEDIRYIHAAKDSNILFIDSIRDSYARKISAFFQNIENHLQLSKEQILNIFETQGIQFFLDAFKPKLFQIARLNAFNQWKIFGYDVLDDAVFDFSKKYQIKRMGNLYFVNLRFDDIDDWEEIIRSLPIPIDLSNFKIIKTNISKDKWYNPIYEAFLLHFTLSRKDFEEVLRFNQKVLAHFYTPDEIEQLIKKWEPHIIGE